MIGKARIHSSYDLLLEAAADILKQIERHDDQCSYWLVSVVFKLTQADPDMTMKELVGFLRKHIPTSVKDFEEYLRTT